MLGVGLVIPYLDLKNTASEFAIAAIIGYASIYNTAFYRNQFWCVYIPAKVKRTC